MRGGAVAGVEMYADDLGWGGSGADWFVRVGLDGAPELSRIA